MDDTGRNALAAFVRRLDRHSSLADEEREALLSLPGRMVRTPRRRDLVVPGKTVTHSILAVEGLLGRFDLMRNGGRQITAIHLPGDLSDLHSVAAPVTGWGVTTLTAATTFRIAHEDLRRLAVRFPAIAMAFWRDTTLDASILAKWIASIGRRNALARLAHFICEMALRSEWAGRGDRRAFRLELTQEQIGDALGLTAVHVNRTFGLLRAQGLAVPRGRSLDVLDWDRLVEVAEFDPVFLLGPEPDDV